jgi:PhnB protein
MKIHDLFPCLCVKDAGQAIEFYVRAFGAREKFRLAEPQRSHRYTKLLAGG